MADSTQGDTDVQYLGLFVPALIALIAGLVIHSFIIGVNVNDWWKGRPVTPVDHIVTSLGISRMYTQCAATLYVFLIRVFLKKMESHITVVILSTVYDFFAYANAWLTSLLCIVLCMKISNFHTRLFLYLRGVIVHRTVYCIVAAVLLSTISCLIPLMMTIPDVTKDGTNNITMHNVYRYCNHRKALYYYIIVSSLPQLFSCIPSVLLITSLYHHTTKMKMSSNLSVNLETYYSVIKFVSFTLMYRAVYLFVNFVHIFYYYFYCVRLPWLRIVLEFLPALHSSYLIYRTAKLRSQMSKALQNLIDFLFQRKDTETRENIQM
ncbi:hypothetical protein GDO78_014249 [Eleutherodactylus coqui]|uniref:Taste receptor type 2 n=1 Tax=Eleutherodactylus coqui TaxID=57060 RepID=A0A8J6JQC4_ELECQ|nr:hypothetical protein GDO78_014249 [Eleutherodactylus coqui]